MKRRIMYEQARQTADFVAAVEHLQADEHSTLTAQSLHTAFLMLAIQYAQANNRPLDETLAATRDIWLELASTRRKHENRR